MQVKIRNNCRRPLVFRCPGETIRLGPGEEREGPEVWLTSAELKRLCSGGLVAEKRLRKRKVKEDSQPAAGDGPAKVPAAKSGARSAADKAEEKAKEGKNKE